MISSNSREVENDSPTKDHHQEDEEGKVGTKLLAISTSPSSSISTPWLRLKDPRIVRVSRAFGGKDRHSKVCTIRGLRDRRVRLSVPTAIQLYDLQDRLGLNQPSKVVDWLLNAAKSEIDELPPLPIQPGSFDLTYHQPAVTIASSHHHHHELGSSSSQLSKEGFKLDKGVEWEELPRPTSIWNMSKEKGVARDINIPFGEKENWMNRYHEENQEEGNNDEGNNNNNNNVHVSSSSFLSRGGGQSSSTGNLVNNGGAYGTSFFNLEAPNFSTSHHLGSHGFASHHHHQHMEDPHGLNEMPLPSTLSLSSGSQILVCPPGSTTTQSNYFPSSSMEIDPRQISHFQMLESSTQLPNNPGPYSMNQSMRPFHYFSVTPRLHSHEDEADNKDHSFHAND